jgi:hypothetical protein
MGAEGGGVRDANVLVRREKRAFIRYQLIKEICVLWCGVFLVSIGCVLPCGSTSIVADDVCGSSPWALAMVCSIARCVHAWSHSGSVMLASCRTKVALLPLEEKTKSSW